MARRVDAANISAVVGTLYPAPFDLPCRTRERRKLGDAAGFVAGEYNGHCLQNRAADDALILEVGSRAPDDAAYYPDIDMVAPAGGKPAVYTRRDGTPYDDIPRKAG